MIAHAYVENDVLSQDGVELVCLLYAKALERIREAASHLEAKRIKDRAAAIGEAMAIVVELQSSLDFERGGELARTLAELYAYIQQRLTEANGSQQPEPLREADRLLETLFEGWREACEASLAPGAALEEDMARADSPGGLTPPTHCWTL